MFNVQFIKDIIEISFNKHYVKNYDKYDSSFYFMLCEIFNRIKDSDYYNTQAQVFLNNSHYINFEKLFNKYGILLEYQPMILLLFEIFAYVSLFDCSKINIDGLFLINELYNNNNFIFLKNIVYEIENTYNLNISLENLNI